MKMKRQDEKRGRGVKVLSWLAGVLALCCYSACSDAGYSDASAFGSPPSASGSLRSPSAESGELAEGKPAEERPGLATGFGQSVNDEWHRQSFLRDASGPKGTDVIYYNDREGMKAMAGHRYRVGAMQKAAGEMVEWGIKGAFTRLPTYKSGGRRFVVGTDESPYSIVIKNRCRSRVEVVLSVDGLDVIHGQPASFSKRGYVIGAGKTLEVKGWRTSWNTVARFEFSSVANSYANRRHGKARNVGVIGLAVFGEKGVDPWKWMPSEVRTRETASPFSTAP